jgi:cytochrome c553
MKKICLITLLVGIVAVYTGLGISGEASVDQGKQLFNDPALGGSSNEANCGSCHPDGRGLEQSGDKDTLAGMINTCIERPLKGQALEEKSTEMESLKLYIKSLSK